MEILLSKILSQIRYQEDKLASDLMPTAEKAYQMTLFLNEMLLKVKAKIVQSGFKNEQQEINFLRTSNPKS